VRSVRPRPAPLLGIAALLLALAAGAAYANRDLLVDQLYRSALWASLSLEQRHQFIALYSRLESRPVETADHVPVQPKVSNPLGVNTFLEQEVEPAKRRRAFELIRAAGFGWIRQQFPWDEIEPVRKGEYVDPKWGVDTWAKYDEIVDLAQEYGIQIIARLDTTPAWARADGAPDSLAPPKRAEDYGDFVYTVVSRYKGKIKHVQIWNEPNLAREWGGQPPYPAAYAHLLGVAYLRAKEADPEVVVLSAALAPTLEDSFNAMSDLRYLQALYDAGAGPFFDVLAVQAYGLRHGPDDRRLDFGDVNFSRPIQVREVMVRNGDAGKPIWVSEVGWNAQPPDLPGTPPYPFGSVSLETQARYTVRALERARTEWPWAGVLCVWFFKRATDHERDQPMYYFRLVEPDFTPLPVYFAIQDYARRMGYVR
jgi:hypothetical protein